MATFPAKTNYAAGDILTAAQMVDIGDQINSVSYRASGNPVLNSSFQIWQRGTSISYTLFQRQFAADRWEASANNGSGTVSRQATSDTTNLPNIQYALRFQRTSGQTQTIGNFIAQNMETVNSIPYAGKTVTVSYYARRGADFSGTFEPRFFSGTGTDQNIYVGLTGQTTLYNTAATLTTTWQRFSFTVNVGATATQLALQFVHLASGTAGTNDWFEITGVQIDLGSVALPFRTYSATLAGELAACQRYYWRTVATTGGDQYLGAGHAKNSTTADFVIQYPTTMRTSPTLFANTGTTYFGFDCAIGLTGETTISNFYSPSVNRVLARFNSSGLTAGQGGVAQTRNAAAYVEASAEL